METPTSSRAGYVALIGWTNVGKSTLLNQLVGVRLAAVADVAQTTRHTILGARTLPGGQLIFVDTPGLHRPRHRMNRAMVEAARQTIGGVDLAVLVVDAVRGYGAGDREAAQLLRQSEKRWILALNKVDLVRPKHKLLPMLQQAMDELGCDTVVPVSALTGDNCDALLEQILTRMPESPPLFPEDYLTDQPERVLAAEWVREKLLAETYEELPHATAVLVERWKEREDGLVEIEATILVDRDSQKKIVIGTGGERLKRIGTAARLQLESFLEHKVFLTLWVKVRADWRNDKAMLRRLGLN